VSTAEREQTQQAWEAIARRYDEFVTPTHMWLGTEAITRAGIAPGLRFLDVAAGSGALSIPAARLGAQVVATDLSPTMVERLGARAREEGLHGVETRVMDGHALELEDDSFDIAGSQYGVMLFPDLPRALSEMARVTKPGGRVFLVVYGPPTQVEFLGFFMGAMQATVPGFTGIPLDPTPLPFQVADSELLRRALSRAGLKDIRVETVVQQMEFHSGKHMWDWVVNSNPLAAMLVADLTGQQKAAVQEALDGMLRERSGGNGAAILTDPNHIGIGTKGPSR
jgi:ubiquinone/menaquinone biosynthesis C-methylase UbiE